MKKIEAFDPNTVIDELDEETRKEFDIMARERWTLYQPTILVVEDQQFSQKLLTGMLARDYPCFRASSIKQAMKEYMEHVPCITLIDVMLEDGNGHSLASAIRSIDPFGYLVMVTANNYEEDVRLAKENEINGFIIKPFNKRKILKTLNNFKIYRKEVKSHARSQAS